MPWAARAREIIRQSDAFIEQTVRITNGTVTKDVPVTYSPGTDAASANANLAAAIRAMIARRASDGSLTAVAPLTVIDLTDPVITPTPIEQQRLQWQTARQAVLRCQRGLAEKIPGFDQARLDAAIASRDALWDASFEPEV